MGGCKNMAYRESIYLGDCKKTRQEVKQVLVALRPEWMGRTYDVLEKNCCSFCMALSKALGVGEVPYWLNRLGRCGDTLRDAAMDIKAGAGQCCTRPCTGTNKWDG